MSRQYYIIFCIGRNRKAAKILTKNVFSLSHSLNAGSQRNVVLTAQKNNDQFCITISWRLASK